MVVYDIYENGVLVGKFNAKLNLPSTDWEKNVMICGGTWSMRPDFTYSHTCEVRYENGADAINQGFTNLGDNNLLFEVKS